MSDEVADYEPPLVAIAIAGGAAGATLGALAGGIEADLGGFPTGWHLALYPLLPILLAALCYSLAHGAGIARSVVLAPVVAIQHICLAIGWVAGYCLIVLPAIGLFAVLYGPLGWTRASAFLTALGAVAVWMFLLSRLPVAHIVDAFYDTGPRACGLLGAALVAVVPALVVGAMLGYYLGYLDDLSWDGVGPDALVGAVLGGLYGLSVGLLVPFTTMVAMMLGESDA